MTAATIKLGIVGACGRGASFKTACDALSNVSIHAVCDVNKEKLSAAKEKLGAREQYADYEDMLEKSDLDAVIIGTPMPLHVPQSIAALERGLHVLSEVPAAVSVEECKALVQACAKAKGIYMMAENYAYLKPNVIVRELVRQGLFGTPYYAEGEYIHDVKDMAVTTPWRRHWQMGIDGITYCTHSLGPILQWMSGDRVVRVCCEGTGVRHMDTEGKPFAQASSTMLCKTERDALIKIRVDLLSDRPHGATNYQLQGVDGCYESSRGGAGDTDNVYLRDRSPDGQKWMKLDELADEFLPDFWKDGMEVAKSVGHGGGDYFEILDFVDAVTGKRPCPIGIHEAMDMTLPGLISQQSILDGGRWIDVPDSREW